MKPNRLLRYKKELVGKDNFRTGRGNSFENYSYHWYGLQNFEFQANGLFCNQLGLSSGLHTHDTLKIDIRGLSPCLATITERRRGMTDMGC